MWSDSEAVDSFVVEYSSRVMNLAARVSQRLKPAPELTATDCEASRHIVTPFTPFVLCDYFVATEIKKYKLSGLNHSAVELSTRNVRELPARSAIYVQVDLINSFTRHLLPRMKFPFILITGKWNLPALTVSSEVLTILSSPLLLAWYSQNQTRPDLDIRPFPFGVRLDGAAEIHARMRNVPLDKSQDVFVPFTTVHGHLDDQVKRIRTDLRPLSHSHLPHKEYLSKISQSRFVISPPGDRPDTYRHWESIALGAVPVTVPIPRFNELFGDSIAFRTDLTEPATGRNLPWSNQANPELATVNYWSDVIERERTGAN